MILQWTRWAKHNLKMKEEEKRERLRDEAAAARIINNLSQD